MENNYVTVRMPGYKPQIKAMTSSLIAWRWVRPQTKHNIDIMQQSACPHGL